MFGYNPYAASPYGFLSNNILLVASCIHVDSQLLYQCESSTTIVYTATVSQSMVYLTDVNITEGGC